MPDPAAQEAPTAVSPGGTCLSCDTALVGEYCHACGQPSGPAVGPFGELVREMAREALDLESRLAATLRGLLLRPGELTEEYVAGRRGAHVSPVRLYLAASVAFGAAMVFADSTFLVSLDGPNPSRALWLRLWLWSVLFMMPVFAGMVRLATGARGFFAADLVFAMHVHAYGYVLAAISLPLAEVSPIPYLDLALVLGPPLLVFGHLVSALRRVYGVGLGRAVAATVGIAIGYLIVLLITLIGAGYLASVSGGSA